MNHNLKSFIPLAYNNKLDKNLTSEAFNIIMSGEATDGQIAAFLIALQKNNIKDLQTVQIA